MNAIPDRILYSALGIAFLTGWRLRGRLNKAEMLKAERREDYLRGRLDESHVEITEFDRIVMDHLK